MIREELISDINSILEENENLSTVVYAVLKETYEVKQLDIVEDEIKNIQKIFIDSIKKNIIDKEELILQKFSEADDRKSDIFEYDLELPKELCFFNAELNDTISFFKFNNDKIINIESLIIEIGTEEKQLRLFKKITPVEILGRGWIVLWLKSNQRFESFNEQVLRFTDSFYALKINNSIFFTNIDILKKAPGFHDIINREAMISLCSIQKMCILDEQSIEGIKELISNISFARKVLKIKNYPVIIKNITNEAIIEFTKTFPILKEKMKYTSDGKQIILKTKLSKELFIKMLDDAFLTSQLTKLFYESKAKDYISWEENE